MYQVSKLRNGVRLGWKLEGRGWVGLNWIGLEGLFWEKVAVWQERERIGKERRGIPGFC